MSALTTWTEVKECKLGAEDLLRRALVDLHSPVVTTDSIRDALASLAAATLALRGCEKAVEKLMYDALRVPDVRAIAARNDTDAAQRAPTDAQQPTDRHVAVDETGGAD